MAARNHSQQVIIWKRTGAPTQGKSRTSVKKMTAPANFPLPIVLSRTLSDTSINGKGRQMYVANKFCRLLVKLNFQGSQSDDEDTPCSNTNENSSNGITTVQSEDGSIQGGWSYLIKCVPNLLYHLSICHHTLDWKKYPSNIFPRLDDSWRVPQQQQWNHAPAGDPWKCC